MANSVEDDIACIITNFFKVVGCGNCSTNENLQYKEVMCRGCFNKTSSGSYWSVSNTYAHSTSKAIIEYLQDEGLL